MSRRPYKALGTFSTPHGIVICRKVMSAKQRSFILVLESRSHAALRLLLPAWRPLAASTRTQISPYKPTKKLGEFMDFYQQQVQLFYERLSGKPVPTATPTTPPPSYTTIGELLRVLERESATVLRTSSAVTYAHHWHALLRVLDPGMALRELTRELLQTVMGRLGQQYASTTLKCLRTALNRALVRAVEDGVLVSNPLTKVRTPKAVAQPKRMITRAQRDTVLAEAEKHGPDVHLACALMLLAGLRRREALAVTWNRNVDLERRDLTVTNDGDDFTSKSGEAERHIPISNDLFAVLTRYHRSNGFVLAPAKLYSAGGRYRWNFTKSFASVARAAGVPWLHPHLSRHVFASLYVECGEGTIFRLSRILGHSAASVTEQYLHLVPGFGSERVAAAPVAQGISA